MATVHAPADCAMPAAICGCPLPMAHPRGICIVLHLLQHQLSPAIVKKRLRRPHGSAPSPPPRATPPASLSLSRSGASCSSGLGGGSRRTGGGRSSPRAGGGARGRGGRRLQGGRRGDDEEATAGAGTMRLRRAAFFPGEQVRPSMAAPLLPRAGPPPSLSLSSGASCSSRLGGGSRRHRHWAGLDSIAAKGGPEGIDSIASILPPSGGCRRGAPPCSSPAWRKAASSGFVRGGRRRPPARLLRLLLPSLPTPAGTQLPGS
jgi:hypothetical protein